MRGTERREQIIKLLSESSDAITGQKLAATYAVSRQVIVQDIALLRAQHYDIISTTKGYVLLQKEESKCSRVFKVIHSDEQVEEELQLIVDYGGSLEDVFVYHKIYGIVKAQMNIRNRMDINLYLENLATSKSSLLKNITSGYHYHTVTASSERVLDLIQEELTKRGFLAKLQDYEPINFWKEEE